MNAAARLIYGLRHSGHISDALISSGLRREYGSRRPCSCTRPLMELRRHTWVNWFVSPICLVDVPSALLGPIICWYRPWNCLPSAAGPSNVISAISVPGLVPRHYHWSPVLLWLGLFRTSNGSWSDFITWTTLKIHDWFIDWLIETTKIKEK